MFNACGGKIWGMSCGFEAMENYILGMSRSSGVGLVLKDAGEDAGDSAGDCAGLLEPYL